MVCGRAVRWADGCCDWCRQVLRRVPTGATMGVPRVGMRVAVGWAGGGGRAVGLANRLLYGGTPRWAIRSLFRCRSRVDGKRKERISTRKTEKQRSVDSSEVEYG